MEELKHHGVKGMRWGVRRTEEQLERAAKYRAEKEAKSKPSIKEKIDSLKRERDWKKVAKDVNNMSTIQIQTAAQRIRLENDLKDLSRKRGVGNDDDRKDYIRRAKLSDDEIKLKVARLRAKDSLRTSIKNADKEQRELGEKIVKVGGTVAMTYANKGSLTPKDLLDAYTNPVNLAEKGKTMLKDEVVKTATRLSGK